MATSMENFGTLEYVLDKYSKTWSWKLTGQRAVSMISKLVPEAWYGENIDEVIIPDSTESVKQLKAMMDRYPLEILSKSAWQRKVIKTFAPKPTLPPIKHKLNRAKTGDQFRGKLLNFQKEGLDFLLKSSGNALLADEMGLGKTVQTLSYVATEKQTFPVSNLLLLQLLEQGNWKIYQRLTFTSLIMNYSTRDYQIYQI
jgi:SNF2 family DNA or RNA helicase